MQVSGVRAIMAVRDALDRQGLVRTSSMNGGYLLGWSDPDTYDNTTMNVRKERDGSLEWTVVVSGKPHLAYHTFREVRGDDTIDLHEPVDASKLHGKIREAFRSIGLEPMSVRKGGCQMHWDDDVVYHVKTDKPSWLAPRVVPVAMAGSHLSESERVNRDPMAQGMPTLCTFRPESGPRLRNRVGALDNLCSDARKGGIRTLAGYVGTSGEPLLTWESIQALASLPVREKETRVTYPEGGTGLVPRTMGILEIMPNGEQAPGVRVLDRASFRGGHMVDLPEPVEVVRTSAEVITNAWGDKVPVWRFPASTLARTRMPDLQQPMVVGGRMVTEMPFLEWDRQFGPSPWNPDPILAPAPDHGEGSCLAPRGSDGDYGTWHPGAR